MVIVIITTKLEDEINKTFKKEEMSDLLIRFVRMCNKNTQQKVIDEIKTILRTIGEQGF